MPGVQSKQCSRHQEAALIKTVRFELLRDNISSQHNLTFVSEFLVASHSASLQQSWKTITSRKLDFPFDLCEALNLAVVAWLSPRFSMP